MKNEIDQSTPNIFKYSTQKNHSSPSDIYIKLSDCQAACRLINFLFHCNNSINYLIDAGLSNVINQIFVHHMFILIIERKNIDIER